MQVYLLRHGETVGNVNGQYAGVTDTPLTEKGKLQAVDAYLRFEQTKFDLVLSSPLSRALDTARVVSDQKIIEIDELMEMNFGKFEGLTYEEIEKKYPEDVKEWIKSSKDYTFPNGESLKGFYEKIVKTYLEILDTYKVDKLLIVAHSGVIKSILAHEISDSFDHYWRYSVDNCKMAIIEYTGKYHYLKALNL